MCVKANQLAGLQALLNGGIEQSVVVLNEILNAAIKLQVFQVEVLSVRQTSQTLEQRVGLGYVSAMRLPFTGTLEGNAALVFSIDSAAQLVAALMHEETDLPDLNAVKRGTLSEVGNIILNGVMAKVGQVMQQSLRYAIPIYFEGTISELLSETEQEPEPSGTKPKESATILLAQTCLSCDVLQLTGNIVLVFTVRSFDTLLLTLDVV